MDTNDILERVLEHHGVKGQKWGVRRDRGHDGERATTKKIAKLDAKFEKSISDANSGRVNLEFHNAAVTRMNRRIDDLNDSPKYRNVDLSTYKGKIKDDYEKDAHEAILTSFEDATRQVYGSNASGTKKGVYNRETDSIDIVDKNSDSVQHANETPPVVPDVTVKLKRNKTGHIVSTTVVPLVKKVSHSDLIDRVLEHHGVKGQKWGVRRAKGGGVHPTGKRSKGEKSAEPASEDAAKAKASSAKAKAHGTDTLSNQELQHLVNRMNLEQQYSRLDSSGKQRSAGGRFAKNLLVNVAKQQVSKLANDAAAKQVAKLLVKAAA